MERRFETRLGELLDDAEVRPGLLRGTLARLESFLEPFVASLCCAEQRTNAHHYVSGLLSDLVSKDAESIAYLFDRERQGIQKFIGQAPWDHDPLLGELCCQVADTLGQPDGVLVFDPSGFAKKGDKSVGVARQWCGRLGKVDNCQVGVFLGYVSHQGHCLVDYRLYLPREWTNDKKRCAEAGVPRDVRFATRHELALQMLDERAQMLPHGWVAGDDEMGRSTWFRQELRQRDERYLLAVPSNTLVRDLLAPRPEQGGRGQRPLQPFMRAERWRAALPEDAWQTVDVRDGEKGPLLTQVATTLVQTKEGGKVSEVAETLLVFREQQSDGSYKHDYLLSAELTSVVSVEELAWVYKAEHRIEECLKAAKSEAGMADYQVRTWKGWHHHMCLALLASWFLNEEARRGKNTDAGAECPAGGDDDRVAAPPGFEVRHAHAHLPQDEPPDQAQRGGAPLPLEAAQPLAPVAL
jgi:SRSO17 transposase